MKKLLFLPIFMIFTIQAMSPDNKVMFNGKEYHSIDLSLFDHVNDDNVELIDKLIKNGADINAIGMNRISLVMQMTMQGRKKVVDRLIELGVRLNDPDPEGNTLLMFNPTGPNAFLLTYVMKLDINTVEKLIKAGANVNAQNKAGNTPLTHAVFKVNLELVKLFVKYGADIDHKNLDGKSAIDITKENHYKEIAEFLEKTRSENVEKRKRRIQEEVRKYISTGSYGPLQYVLEYAEEYVPELQVIL